MVDEGGDEEYAVYYRSPEENPSEVILHAVAEETGRDLLDLRPLSEVTDPDAIDSLFTCGPVADPSLSASFAMTYGGCEVIVERAGVRVRKC